MRIICITLITFESVLCLIAYIDAQLMCYTNAEQQVYSTKAMIFPIMEIPHYYIEFHKISPP